MNRKISTILICALAATLLSACGQWGASVRGVKHFTISDEMQNDEYYTSCQGQGIELNIYNWHDYISDGSGGGFDVIKEFEQLTGIKVNYSTYDTNEELYAALVSGDVVYDVIFPSDYMVHQLIEEGRLAKLDFDNIPHFRYIMDKYSNLPYDSTNEYSVPYKWGTVVLIYNKKYVTETVDSWDILWNEKYRGRIAMLDNPRDAFGIALKRLGYSMNTTDEEEIMAAYQALLAQNPLVLGYFMDEMYEVMGNGMAYLAPYYAGDAYRMMLDNPDLAVAYPREGVNLFVDAMCIPVGSTNKEAAEMFINFMSDPVVAAVNSEYTGYSTPNDLSYWYLSDHLKYNDLVYPSDDTLSNTEMFLRLPDDINALQARLWVEITTSSAAMGMWLRPLLALLAVVFLVAIVPYILRRRKAVWRESFKIQEKRHFYWNTVIAFVSSLILVSAICTFYAYNKIQVESMNMTNLLTEKSRQTSEVLARYMQKAQSIALFALDGYTAEEFYYLSRMLFDDHYIRNISIAPGGVIQDVYPLEGFEGVLGLDLINREQGSHEIKQAIETGNAILTGPFQSQLDDMILAGRVPVYTTGPDGEQEFWGIVSISIIYPDVLDIIDFDDFNTHGFDYKIWRISPDNGEAQTIYGGAIEDVSSNRYIEERLNFYDTDWYFRVYSLRPWYRNYDIWALAASGLSLCVLITMLAHSHNKTKEMRDRLQKLTGALIHMSVKLLSESDQPFNSILSGEAHDLSRIVDIDKFSIWRHTARPDGPPLISRVFKWDEAAGEVTEQVEQHIDISYDKLFPGWDEQFLRNEDINKPVRELSDTSIAAFGKVGVVSVLATPIFINNVLWGFVNYMDSRNERYFSSDHVRFLRSAAFLFANAIIRNDMQEEVFNAEELSRLKSSFLASMSHEIRTPMNAIIGMSELLSKERLSEHQQQYVGDIWTSATSLLAIINDILDISKIESGKFELLPVHYNFAAMIENVRAIFRIMAQKKGIDYLLEMSEDVPTYLYGDDIRLKQVLVNLSSNAVKFTEHGSVMLQVTADEETITMKVIDTGVGIPEQALEGIFDPFTQADTKKHRHIKGTGLGLSISKQFVEMMGGSIKAESEVGEGSVFTVTVPKTIGDETQVAAADDEVEPFYAPTAQILVTDDNALNLKVASGFLEMYGIKADTAESGEEALRKVQEKTYDLVFMDHMMPGMDGVETTGAIRRLGGDFAELPIVALTANSIVGSEEVFLANGLNGYLSKPIEARRLADVLGRWIPADKMEERPAATEQATTEAPKNFLDRLAEIPGINIEKGLGNLSHKEALYEDMLEMFSNRAAGECESMSGFLAEGNIERFAIAIHGIKASLLTLGISELSTLAAAMEMEAKAGNMAFCQKEYPPFREKVQALNQQLCALFVPAGQTAGGNGLPKENADFLLEHLQQFVEAAENFDTDEGIEILTKLGGYDFNDVIGSLLKQALEATKGFDYDTAVEKVRKVAGLCE
jgi:spermidine/putrescine transport system substrate-binding protein